MVDHEFNKNDHSGGMVSFIVLHVQIKDLFHAKSVKKTSVVIFQSERFDKFMFSK